MSYGVFAAYYDGLITADADYKKRVRHISKLFREFDRMPSLLLDVGCGTGGFSLEFAKSGIEVIGIDPSEEMLSRASEKAMAAGLNILFLCQSAEELDLYGTVDGAVCGLDTVNHVLSEKELRVFFSRIALFLEKDRLFIFDANTPYKHKNVLADNIFVLENDEVYCVWQNAHNEKTEITDITLDFFEKSGDAYIRSTENFGERAYSRKTLEKLLHESGFSVLSVTDEDGGELREDSERMIFTARRV